MDYEHLEDEYEYVIDGEMPTDMYDLVRQSAPKELSEALERNINEMASQDPTVALKAMDQVKELLVWKPKSYFMIQYEERFIIAITDQLKHLANYDPKAYPDVCKVYGSLFTLMFKYTQCEFLGRQLTTPVLKDLLHQIIVLLADDKLNYKDSHAAIEKVCELIMAITVYTNIFCALIQLLYDCVKTGSSSRVTELVMKFLRQKLPDMPDARFNDIDFDTVLLEVHLFLKEFPTVWWDGRPVEMRAPLRSIKTITHAMCSCMGIKLRSYFNKIPDTNDSELEGWISKMLEKLATGDWSIDLD